MNKYKKLIVLLLIIAVGVILFIYPKSFKQTYKDVQVFENGKKSLIGTNEDLVCSFGLYAAKDVANTFKLKRNSMI